MEATIRSAKSARVSHTSIDRNNDNVSTFSDSSMASRVSKVETNMGEMKSMLRQLVEAHCKTSPPPTQRSRSTMAEPSKGGSAESG